MIILSFDKQCLANDNKLGVHVLYTEEVNGAADLLPNGGYITIPITTREMDIKKWQEFLDEADRHKLIPIIRLATENVGKSWKIPTKRNIVDFANFFNKLDWHSDKLIVVLFNEPNQAGEWGGKISPDEYGEILSFGLNWLKTEDRNYFVLPAALDAAADGRNGTMSATVFLKALVNKYSETILKLDAWNSHAYPNPGFSGKPTDTHASSVKSYIWELNYLKNTLGREFDTYITETGWDNSRKSPFLIAQYFRAAYLNTWQADEKVRAVTPFLYNAQTLPFSKFSLINKYDKPAPVYEMIRELNKI